MREKTGLRTLCNGRGCLAVRSKRESTFVRSVSSEEVRRSRKRREHPRSKLPTTRIELDPEHNLNRLKSQRITISISLNLKEFLKVRTMEYNSHSVLKKVFVNFKIRSKILNVVL